MPSIIIQSMNNHKTLLLAILITIASVAVYGADWTPPTLQLTKPIQDAIDQIIGFICLIMCMLVEISAALAALLLIISGARYIAADNPESRVGIRRFMIGVIVGLVIVILAVPILNYVMDSILPAVACTCVEGSEEAISDVLCNLIGALNAIAPWICALMVVYGGIRYLTSADDPGARKGAKAAIIAAFVGMVIVMIAIPVVNMALKDQLENDTIDIENCSSLDEEMTDQIISILGDFLCVIALIAPPICALVATYGGLRYVVSADDAGARNNARTIIISALIGMVIVMLAVPMVNAVLSSSFTSVTFSCSEGSITEDVTDILCNFICFISYIAPAICGLIVIYGGFRYLTSGEDARARAAAKTIIIGAFIGMVLVFIAVPIVNLILTTVFGQVACDCSKSSSVAEVVDILCKFICLIADIAPRLQRWCSS